MKGKNVKFSGQRDKCPLDPAWDSELGVRG